MHQLIVYLYKGHPHHHRSVGGGLHLKVMIPIDHLFQPLVVGRNVRAQLQQLLPDLYLIQSSVVLQKGNAAIDQFQFRSVV